MRKIMLTVFVSLFLIGAPLLPSTARAESTSEDKWQELFVTAGYATAFGAALGAACLSFYDNPQDHLQYVAVGASLGFIGGSVLGSYLVLSPVVAENPVSGSTLLSDASMDSKDMAIRPVFNSKTGSLIQLEGAWTLARF